MIQIDDIAGGIVRHAGDAAMRSDVDWDTIRAGLLALADHPGGHTALKTALERINDPDVKEVLAIWFRQAAEEQQKAERKTKRPAETGLGPLQTTLMGLSGAAVIAGLAGTIALPVAAFVFATLAVGAGAAWFGRMKLLERADQYEDRAKTLNSLVKLCHNDQISESCTCRMITLYRKDEEIMMTLFEILLSASAVCLSAGVIAYTVHVVRKTAEFERPDDAQIRHMIDTAPRGKFDNVLAR